MLSDDPAQGGLTLRVGDLTVSASLDVPAGARRLLVFAHGAGAGMRHPFMEAISRALAERGVGTFRYNFPYMERGAKRPDHRNVLVRTVRAAVELAHDLRPDLSLLAGGKSMGGRMTSNLAAESPFPSVEGIVFFGFPLHAVGQPTGTRADHLRNVSTPMLFLQGTRDKFAELDLVRSLCEGLGRRAKLHVVEGADHSFHVLKRSGRSDDEVIEELAEAVAAWSPRPASG